MADRLETKIISFEGGKVQTVAPLLQGAIAPGSCIEAVNFEPGLTGGYRRVTGFSKYDSNAVTGTGTILGVFVFPGGGSIIACRGNDIYTSTGTGWTAINGADSHAGAVKYRAAKYSWGTEVIALVDGANHPCKWDGTTYTELVNAPLGAVCIAEFKRHLFFGKGTEVTFSAPGNDTDYNVANGAGVINASFDVIGLAAWRDELYVFGTDAIAKITGSSSTTFALVPVTNDLGLVDADSIREVGGDLVFLSPDGIRTIAGTERIGDVELAAISRNVHKDFDVIRSHRASGYICSVVVRQKSQYRLFATNSGVTTKDAVGILGGLYRSSEGSVDWAWFELRGIQAVCADSDYIDGDEVVVHAEFDGYVYQQESGNSFDGASIHAYFQIPWLNFDSPAIRKVLHKIRLYIEVEGGLELTLTPRLDYNVAGTLQPPIQTLSGSAAGLAIYDDSGSMYDDAGTVYDGERDPVFDVNMVGSGRTLSLQFTTNDTRPPYTVKTAEITYAVGGLY